MSNNLELTRINPDNPDNPGNQLIISEENLIRTLSGDNIRISSNDEINKTIIQNVKSYVFQQNMKTPYMKLGTFLPEIIKDMKKKPELTKIFDFFDDIKNNTLEKNLPKYITDTQTLENLQQYISLANKQIEDIHINTVSIRGGSKKRQRKTEIKKGGSPKLIEIISTDKKELNYYSIIGLNYEESLETETLLIYFQFSLNNGTKNFNEIRRVNSNMDDLNAKSLKIFEDCAKDVFTDESKKEEVSNKYIAELNALDDSFNSTIQIEGNIYLFLYDPDSNSEEKAKVVCGPYKAEMDYNFKDDTINSLTSEKLNLNLLNLYMQSQGLRQSSAIVQEPISLEGLRKELDYNTYITMMSKNTPTLSKLEEEELINELGLSAEDIKKESQEVSRIAIELAPPEYPSYVNAENIQKLIMILGVDSELVNALNKTNFKPIWVNLDKSLPLVNKEESIWEIFDGVQYYKIKDGIIDPEPKIQVWYLKKKSVSLYRLSTTIKDDKYNSYNIIFDSILALQNDQTPKVITDKLKKIDENVQQQSDRINSKITILNQYVDMKKLQNEQAKSKIVAYSTVVTFIVLAIFLLTMWKSIILFIAGYFTADVGAGFINRWTGVDLNPFKSNISIIVTVALAALSYAAEFYKTFTWLVYEKLLVKIFKRIPGLDFLVIDELDYPSQEAAIAKLSAVLKSKNPNEMKAIADLILSDDPKAIVEALKGGSRKKRTHHRNDKKTVKNLKKKYSKNKLKSKHKLKTKKYNKTKKLKMVGGTKSTFFSFEIINTIVSIQDLFMFPENYPIYNTSSVFDEIYKIILEIKIPAPDSNKILVL
jgi:hypothetical protein